MGTIDYTKLEEKWVWLGGIIGGTISIAVILAVVITIIMRCRKSRRARRSPSEEGIELEKHGIPGNDNNSFDFPTIIYAYDPECHDA